MPAAIFVSGLSKTFGSTRALDGLDLMVDTGEVHGFLGPNGSGKTTTIRVLLGLLRADAGQVTLLSGASRTCPVRSRSGRSSAGVRSSTSSVVCGAISIPDAATSSSGATSSTRPKVAHLLEGQSPEGRPGRGTRVQRRALDVLPLVALTVIAGGLIALGLAGFRQRDTG